MFLALVIGNHSWYTVVRLIISYDNGPYFGRTLFLFGTFWFFDLNPCHYFWHQRRLIDHDSTIYNGPILSLFLAKKSTLAHTYISCINNTQLFIFSFSLFHPKNYIMLCHNNIQLVTQDCKMRCSPHWNFQLNLETLTLLQTSTPKGLPFANVK